MRKRETRNKKPGTSSGPMPRSALRTPRLIVRALLDWFSVNARDLPWRRTLDPYAIWVSEIMLQQTQVKTVIPYWERWMRTLPTVQSLAAANPDTIHKLWEGLGYYTRVRNMQQAAQVICAEHGGTFPSQFEAILALPGIGRYTAGAIASIAFNQPAPILDGNVIRVLCRLHGIADNPGEKQTNARLWRLADELVTHAKNAESAKLKQSWRPSRPLRETNFCSHLNQSLMELGALVCTPRSPNCDACPLARHCVARKEQRTDELPRPKQRAATTARRFIAFVIEHKGRWLVQQRAADGVNAHLWEFPNVEANGATAAIELAGRQFGSQPVAVEKFCTIKHAITRYRITTEACRLEFNRHTQLHGTIGTWCNSEELRALAFTSAHRRIANKVLGVKAS